MKVIMVYDYFVLQIDTNGKGTLDYGEFIAVSLHLQRMANDEHLRKAFSYFDKNGNGYIEPDELQDALMEDGSEDCTNVANDIFQEVDTDKVIVKISFGLVIFKKLDVYIIFLLFVDTGWSDQL